MNDPDVYDILGFAMGVAMGVGSFTGAFLYLRHPNAHPATYWKWVVLLTLWSVAAPVAYYLTCPCEVSLVDAFFLQERHAGWRHPFVAYCTLAGVAVAGIAKSVVAKT